MSHTHLFTRGILLDSQVKLDEMFDQLLRDLRNQRNWVSKVEDALATTQQISEEKEELRKQVESEKVDPGAFWYT